MSCSETKTYSTILDKKIIFKKCFPAFTFVIAIIGELMINGRTSSVPKSAKGMHGIVSFIALNFILNWIPDEKGRCNTGKTLNPEVFHKKILLKTL